MLSMVLPVTVGGSGPPQGVLLGPLIKKGVVDMITWQDLFAFCMVIIALISLIVQIMR